MKETLGDKLKKARKIKGFSQLQIAKQIGTYQQRYQNWETNKSTPGNEFLVKIANATGVSVQWLIESDLKKV